MPRAGGSSYDGIRKAAWRGSVAFELGLKSLPGETWSERVSCPRGVGWGREAGMGRSGYRSVFKVAASQDIHMGSYFLLWSHKHRKDWVE